MMGQPNLCIHVFIRHHTVRLYVHTVHTIWRKQTDTGKQLLFYYYHFLTTFSQGKQNKPFGCTFLHIFMITMASFLFFVIDGKLVKNV